MYRNDLNTALRERYGTKVYKLSLSSGCSCPNRENGGRGCIFCDGAGAFAAAGDITHQIAAAKERVAAKVGEEAKYIAYFQSFTNTYGGVERLEPLFSKAIEGEDIVALSIATRPDCLGRDVMGGAEATAVVTDMVPIGTKLVSGSISDGGQMDSTGKISWNLTLAKDETKTVSFKVEVLPEALSGKDDVQDITNTATIQVGNDPAYVTNTTYTPPEGKKVVDAGGNNITGSVKVGDILVYRIRFYNDTAANADVTITDIIPTGTTYIDGSATHGGTYANGKLTWVIPDVQPGYDGVVSFEVVVDASAKQNTTTGATQPDSGDITILNNAEIQIGTNGPKQTTNSTETKLSTGSMSVTKHVETADKQDESFTVVLSDTKGNLSGTYVLESSVSGASTVTFTGGKSGKLTIRHGETLTVKGLPIGTGMIVEEVDLAVGWTASYADNEPNDVYEQRVLIYADEAYAVTVTNRYTVTPVSFRLKGTKTYVGSNFPEGSYSFYAKASDENGNILTGNDAISVFTTVDYPNTSFTFSTREFTKAETRYYVVDEAATAIPGVTSSGVKYLLRLQIEDVNAKLVVTASYKTGDGTTWANSWTAFDWEDGSVEFINTYP